MARFFLLGSMIFTIALGASAEVYTVNPEGTGDFPTIQAAIDAAQDGDIIELTDGTFTGPGNAWFGYRGKAITVRSQGGNPEACIIDCQYNAGGVSFDEDEGPESVLEGITITNAWNWDALIRCWHASPTIVNCIFSENWNEWYGGTMLLDHSSPALADCIFRRNSCLQDCGGLISRGSSSPTLIRCTFFRNESLHEGPGAVLCSGGSATFDECRFSENESDWIGGVKCRDCRSVRFTNCLFRENAADSSDGGGLHSYLCDSVIVVNCSFAGNSAIGSGGGFYCNTCPYVTVAGCTFSENWATEHGGGMICGNHGYAALGSCTFAENLASDGGGLFCSGSISMLLDNCVFGFSPQGGGVRCSGSGSIPRLRCCDIYGNAGGDWVGCIADQYGVEGNISEDPLFCEHANPDYPYMLQAHSPCIPDSNPECGLIGAWDVGCDPWEFACCVGEQCLVLTEQACAEAGGEWQVGTESCDPNPCAPTTWACCVEEECVVLTEEDCTEAGGEWRIGFGSCDPNPCSGQFLVVNPQGTGDFPTIQAAIDSAGFGDIIELTDGTFTGDGNRDVDFRGKAVWVRSRSRDPAVCIIYCQGTEADPHRGFSLTSAEGPGSRLDAVTITCGFSYGPGGSGMLCHGSSPTISNCVMRDCSCSMAGGAMSCAYGSFAALVDCEFRGNSARYGGALHCYESSPEFFNCSFADNSAVRWGGAFTLTLSSPVLTNCTFAGNSTDFQGGVLWSYSASHPELVNCTLVENSAPDAAAIYLSGSAATIQNSIIAFNGDGEAIMCYGGGSAALSCCDVYGNAGGDWVGCIAQQYGLGGNISEDPWFCDPGNGDFALHEDSPCAPFSPPNPECDLIGAWPVGCGPMAAPERVDLPATLLLRRNVPNPFAVLTRIDYSVPGETRSPVVLTIHDASGRLIRNLLTAPQHPGTHSVFWDGTDQAGASVASGVYFYQLRWNGKSETRRMLLVR